ncbi:MAG: hypothetical protein LQ338_002489 [Usnochroma carphineum]|nr:MAG: hypothetical protein LQ338_002489 [Usnochroma carphineum]
MRADTVESPTETPNHQEAPISTAAMTDQAVDPKSRYANPKWAFWRRDKDPFSGKKYYDAGYCYRRPKREYVEEEFIGAPILDEEKKYRHRDIYGRITHERKDVLRYISPTESHPRPLLVQATPEVVKSEPAGDWRRVKLKGNVPTILKVSEWALRDSSKAPEDSSEAPQDSSKASQDNNRARKVSNFCLKCLRVILVDPVIMVLLSLPLEKIWDEADFDESYTEFPNYTWDYPKYARNKLDAKPGSESRAINGGIESGHKSLNLSSKVRLLRPRLLMVLDNGQWQLTDDTSSIPYAFISFTTTHFRFRPSPTVTLEQAAAAQQTVEELAQRRTEEAGMKAYWVDFRCCAPDAEKERHTADVHRMCDVIRAAEYVFVLLPDLSREKKLEWGARMWTLPEALLARRQEIRFYSPTESVTVSKIGMADHVWDNGEGLEGDQQPTRLLAEHYSGVLTLGRLELFTIALEALAARRQNGFFSQSDTAYALMGLLHYRIDLDHKDTLFQALAKLSLANDSDRLVERMVCMFPNPKAQDTSKKSNSKNSNRFQALTGPDHYGSQLWDIEPLCQVAGVGEDDQTLILDSCRGVSIRWKAFPQMKYKRSHGFRKLIAEIVLRSGVYWSGLGLGLIIKYASGDPSQDAGLIFLGCVALVATFLLGLGAPRAVRRLYGGRVMQSAPWLVGFEGVMPVDKLETLIFGNCNQDEPRLTYEPSSTPFSERDQKERIGLEPGWISDPSKHKRPELPTGHRFFTLVDTGSLTVSVFSARRPPSVALVCGREGGMLRTVLCHYERSDNCLYKETVVRMDSLTLHQAKGLSWIKIGLGDNRERLTRRSQRVSQMCDQEFGQGSARADGTPDT